MKRDLLEMKQIIEMVSKMYGAYDVYGKDLLGDSDNFLTVKNIIESIDTSKSVECVKNALEEYSSFLNKRGFKFEKIEAFFPLDLYVSKNYILSNDDKKTITKNDVLLDIIPASLLLCAYEYENSNDYMYDDFFAEKFVGNIKYSDFVREFEKEGYDISPKSFDELFQQDVLKGITGFSVSKVVNKEKKLKR